MMRKALFGDEIHIYQNEYRPTGPNGHLDHKFAYPQSLQLQGYGTYIIYKTIFQSKLRKTNLGKSIIYIKYKFINWLKDDSKFEVS